MVSQGEISKFYGLVGSVSKRGFCIGKACFVHRCGSRN